MYICIYVYMRVCVCVCVCINTIIYIYIHKQTDKPVIFKALLDEQANRFHGRSRQPQKENAPLLCIQCVRLHSPRSQRLYSPLNP